jgi:F-type H+-transporting ATPase subunit b
VVSLDYSLGIQIVNFLVLIFILNVLLYKPVLGMIDKRKKQLADSEAEIERLQGEVDGKMAAYEAQLLQAKTSAVARKNEIVHQGAEEAKAVVNAVRGEIPALMEQFQGRMDREMAAAKAVLAGESRKLSMEIAEKVLGRALR